MLKYFREGFKERVLEAYKLKSVSALSRQLGESNSTIDAYLNGANDTPTQMIEKFSRDTSVSAHWLLTGKGEKYVTDEPENALFFEAERTAKQLTEPVHQVLSKEMSQMIDQKLKELLEREKQMEK